MRRTDMTEVSRRAVLQWAGLASLLPVVAACSSGSGTTRLGLAASNVKHEPGSPEAIPEVVSGMSSFAGALLGKVGTDPGNVVISPYSVAVALAMTVNGARGKTRTEMLDVLGAQDTTLLDEGLDALTRELKALAGEKTRADGSKATLTLDAANALFGQRDETWEQPFLDALARYYGAGMRLVDYKSAAEQARTLINSWTSDQTRAKIPQIIPPGVLDDLTRLVLVNAIYLKAPWESPFEKTATAAGAFHRADGSTVQADLMRQLLESGSYAESDTWQAAQLPYAGRGLAMTVVLPGQGAMGQVWKQMTGGGLGTILAAPRPRTVDLTLPKWTFRTQAAIAGVLAALGMPTAFDPNRADLSGMTTAERLHVSAVLHEAFIAVDEEGTEAAAATAVVAGATAMPVTVPMNVDRPYLFAIHDLQHSTPLFVGRVEDPTA